jgi:haloalkane dehalogenase
VPGWLDRAAYPFLAHSFDTGEGRLHYVDEGAGPPVVLVHGTPTWSFLYRRLIPRLVGTGHRVIAPDHLGFGLSDTAGDTSTRAADTSSYRPEDHARRLAALLDALGLRDLTLVVHDFGGPIGLSYAVERPERVARLVVLNTWLWPLDGDSRIARGSRLAAGPLGRFLYLRLNASPRWLIPAGFADRTRLDSKTHQQYLAPFPTPASRVPLWVLARELLGSSAWYDGLWRRRERLRGKPALLLWGARDPAFGPAYLARWREALPGAAVVELPDAGHFVQEEAAADVASRVAEFLARTAPAPRAGDA